MGDHDGTSAFEDGSQHGRYSLTKRYLGERPGLWHLAGPAGAGIGPTVPSGTAVPGRGANQGDQLTVHDMEAADPALHAGNAKLQGCHLAAQLRTELGAQLSGAPALWAALTESLPSGTASVSTASDETQGHQMLPVQEMSLPSSLRPRGAGHSIAGESTLPTAQAPTANSRLLAAGPYLLGPALERGKRSSLRLWVGDGQGQKGWGKGEWRNLGSCRAEPNQQRAFPRTLNPTYPFPKDC